MKRIHLQIFIVVFIIFVTILTTGAKTLIVTNKAARVGNELILVSDVTKYSELYGISYDLALSELISQALLYLGAKVYAEEPTKEAIDHQIRDDKAYFASRSGRNVKEVSDEEFLAAIHMNSYSMKTYREYVKKQLWIGDYLHNEVTKQQVRTYYPAEKEIQEVISSNPEMFEEKEGVALSMIYFSFYDSKGKIYDDKKLDKQKKRASKCLTELFHDQPFEDMVSEYTDDLITLNTHPKGFVGIISLDDPRSLKSFNQEILDTFHSSEEGIINRIFETLNGLYIFKIEKKIEARILSEDASRIKAESYLLKQHELNLRNTVKETLLEKMEKITDIVIF